MVDYVGQNGLITSFQSGFRPGHSMAIAIARVFDDSRLNMESNQPTILVLLDFSMVACVDDVSPLAPLVNDVFQESPISPLCFSLFIYDMTEVLVFSKYHMYADDLQIYHSRSRVICDLS
jgi:hypothetical protein